MRTLISTISFFLLLVGASAQGAPLCEDLFLESSAAQIRTRHILEDQMLRELEEGLESSKWRQLQRHPAYNIIIVASSLYGLSKGTPPLLLPEIHYQISPTDMKTLLNKGLNSPEGEALLQKYIKPYEIHRKYEIFKKYYTRFALALIAYLLLERTREAIEESHLGDEVKTFSDLMTQIDELLKKNPDIKTKEDVLFLTVTENFEKKYSRKPTTEEVNMICGKVYQDQPCRLRQKALGLSSL